MHIAKFSACLKLDVLTLFTSVGNILLHNSDFLNLEVKYLTIILSLSCDPNGKRKIIMVLLNR